MYAVGCSFQIHEFRKSKTKKGLFFCMIAYTFEVSN